MIAKSLSRSADFGILIILIVFCIFNGRSDLKAEEYKAQRENIFEFVQKPKITRNGDKVSIAFETKGFCDVTIAIENSSGKIIRHLVSGLLGSNAPAPLKKNSKKQIIIWDGKDDQEKYAVNKDDLTIRVSLGLKPQFEKTLFHSPYKRFGRNQPAMAASPEGVYVYEGDITDNVRLFDHNGNYIRTIYPFPNDKLKQVKGLRWRTTLDGLKVPFKEGAHQATFFGSGYNGGFNPNTGFGDYNLLTKKHYDGLPSDPGAKAIVVQGNRIALVGFYLNRLATDGTTGGLELKGSKTGVQVTPGHLYGKGPKNIEMMPRSAALSPDRKWLYLTGYTWYNYHGTGGASRSWLHGVLRVSFDGKVKPKPFVGSMINKKGMAGKSNDKFNSPTSVACDSKGLVYVSDYVNNRIQIFTPDGKFKESIKVNRPAHVAIHQKTGEIYVFSWTFSHSAIVRPKRVEPKMTRFEGNGKHKKIAEYNLPLGRKSGARRWGGWMGTQYRVELDSWAKEPTIWLVPEKAGGDKSWAQWGIKLLTIKKNKLIVKKDFGIEARKAVTCDYPTGGRQRISLDPKTGNIYIISGIGMATGNKLVEVNPEKNSDRFITPPFGAEDICFDINGLAYLRTGDIIGRYDPKNWKEVPWDYGVERKSVGHVSKSLKASLISGLAIPGTRPGPWFHCGGFGISAKGHLVVQCFNEGLGSNSKLARPGEKKLVFKSFKKYKPKMYAGRKRWGEIHIWDSHGKVISQDVIPGITITDGVLIDKDDNVYALTNPMRTPNGKKILNPLSETLIKFKAGKGRIITSGKGVPVQVPAGQEPDRPTDMYGYYQAPAWVEGSEWMFGGVGYAGTWRCTCWNSRIALDYYARTFAPEPDRFSIAVLDTAGNVILRIGKPGNVDDGKPLIPDPIVKNTRSIGGDETALMHACYVAVDSDKRLVIEDTGNKRILSVKIGYHTNEKIKLKNISDEALKK